MAAELQLVGDLTFKAAADLSAAQYKFVKISAADTVALCSAATDIPIGILQNKPSAAGRAASVRIFGVSKVSADAAIAAGDLLGTSADGQADPKVAGTDTTHYVAGVALSACSNAGEIVSILLGAPALNRGA